MLGLEFRRRIPRMLRLTRQIHNGVPRFPRNLIVRTVTVTVRTHKVSSVGNLPVTPCKASNFMSSLDCCSRYVSSKETGTTEQ
ncbi:hypothetical protein HMPREF1287_01813 [Corynebacterium sp. KPL1986]|uniref:Uncharacterized protein n=1 Tax=Corynebacterium segmentosum TaxID=43990 RepID=A0ABY6TBN5_9CORY|nr:hypothetical protein HMPREF1293_00191 [Corynebacterium sp. KPL1996]ERS45297.1 hypothetical protein HMPREF1287_01813 [Corynebacterium sp. KPL1986]ERS54893.1 hypothetical protein HMPREF1267_00197 [Corynebacterium sp. KPL1824]ERS60914.1 hypothetical protein HMPREF1261_00582 [Corynebacterium sp. KPL1818]ERS73660.1 hypothetical protein HMPREF1295_00633 [Corynebacterium sp. KPL1998]ERS76136.1 hypothetical protein HMPREF1300_00190 [Corynebacterium sp. KPL2004]VEH71838.1 Uncharacterised protein [C